MKINNPRQTVHWVVPLLDAQLLVMEHRVKNRCDGNTAPYSQGCVVKWKTTTCKTCPQSTLPSIPIPLAPVQAVAAGAEVLCGGGPPADADAASTDRTPGTGYYVAPTILSGVKEGDEAWEQEIFGPVLCVMKFEDEAEAVGLANRSQYGLAAAVMSADKTR